VIAEPDRYVLDSFALLAYFDGEPGGPQVRAVLQQAAETQAEVFLSIINYGESVYVVERERGLNIAQSMIATVDQLPIIEEADRRLTFAAAHLKAHYPISYADAFAVALAQQKQATILTGDPEFRKIAQIVTIEWLPQS
jgi:predicted nucleic acid-binding protein